MPERSEILRYAQDDNREVVYAERSEILRCAQDDNREEVVYA